jgi:hypothetical protein
MGSTYNKTYSRDFKHFGVWVAMFVLNHYLVLVFFLEIFFRYSIFYTPVGQLIWGYTVHDKRKPSSA